MSWLSAGEAATHACVQAVEAAGGEPVPLLREAGSWTADLPGLDGLILTGGNAVDPRRYGEENHGLCRLVIPRRDELEQEAFEHCVGEGKPVLGVCRGMQFVNVAPDGVVEGVEAADGRFVVGVQFHPEFAGEVPEVAPIFEVLVAHARGR